MKLERLNLLLHLSDYERDQLIAEIDALLEPDMHPYPALATLYHFLKRERGDNE